MSKEIKIGDIISWERTDRVAKFGKVYLIEDDRCWCKAWYNDADLIDLFDDSVGYLMHDSAILVKKSEIHNQEIMKMQALTDIQSKIDDAIKDQQDLILLFSLADKFGYSIVKNKD